MVVRNELAFPWDILQALPTDVTFITPEHYDKIQLAAEAFKVFLQGNVLAIVFDDTFHDLVDSKDFRKTAVLRKDLVTGKQENDGFRIMAPTWWDGPTTKNFGTSTAITRVEVND